MIRVAVIALMPCMAQASEPWQGAWAFDPAWCEAADKIGSVSPAPIRLTADEFLGYENSCVLTRVEDIGLNAWGLSLHCESEGDFYEDDRIVMVHNNKMWMWYGLEAPTEFRRCVE